MDRRTAGITGGALVVAAVLLGVLVTLVPVMSAPDSGWHDLMVGLRAPWMIDAALFFNWIGGGWRAVLLVPLGFAAVLLVLRRRMEALFALTAFALSAGLVQVIKHIAGRARPEDLLVPSDFGSFPSGHTANAATIALVLWLIAPRVWVAVLGTLWTLAMALSRTILSVHWLTDTIGGMLVGAGAPLLVAALLWGWLRWDRRPPQAELAA
ncbi:MULTISPECIES: phosphatase PAP2 family protein [unclassified Microbacterium]|uniref:phosphatase PAP2 family protein n=1 Tax=unclassified Microbacterium TaxID=2609290 RepID=UPI0012FA089C|nr:phosphatase PAP2 family protein [Microbacterium sp. MAH-37]MVQ40877.1 phosphatase PAP2 family protein [Microbacterium sp. MAH-37]